MARLWGSDFPYSICSTPGVTGHCSSFVSATQILEILSCKTLSWTIPLLCVHTLTPPHILAALQSSPTPSIIWKTGNWMVRDRKPTSFSMVTTPSKVGSWHMKTFYFQPKVKLGRKHMFTLGGWYNWIKMAWPGHFWVPSSCALGHRRTLSGLQSGLECWLSPVSLDEILRVHLSKPSEDIQ